MSENSDPTQASIILRELVRQHGRWVPMPELAQASGAYAVHSRVAELRGRGYAIESKIEGRAPRRSYYRLTSPVQLEISGGITHG